MTQRASLSSTLDPHAPRALEMSGQYQPRRFTRRLTLRHCLLFELKQEAQPAPSQGRLVLAHEPIRERSESHNPPKALRRAGNG